MELFSTVLILVEFLTFFFEGSFPGSFFFPSKVFIYLCDREREHQQEERGKQTREHYVGPPSQDAGIMTWTKGR